MMNNINQDAKEYLYRLKLYNPKIGRVDFSEYFSNISSNFGKILIILLFIKYL